MKTIYISHPFTGNEVENLKHSEEIRQELQKKHPDKTFINPLTMFGGRNSELTHGDAVLHACDVLARCDGMILCDGWNSSKGCFAEWVTARMHGLEISDIDDFLAPPKEAGQ